MDLSGLDDYLCGYDPADTSGDSLVVLTFDRFQEEMKSVMRHSWQKGEKTKFQLDAEKEWVRRQLEGDKRE